MLGYYNTKNLVACEVEKVENVIQNEDKNGNLTHTHTSVGKKTFICEQIGDHVKLVDNNAITISLCGGYTYVNGSIYKINHVKSLRKVIVTKKYVTKQEIDDLQNSLRKDPYLFAERKGLTIID